MPSGYDPRRFAAQPFPGVTWEALKYLYLDRHVLMHGHEPLDTDNTLEQQPGTPLPTHVHALRRGTDGVLRETR